MKKLFLTLAAAISLCCACSHQQNFSGNPIFPGRYADPEAVIWDDEYWIFPTASLPFEEQTYLDAFSSKDLVNWTKHERIIDNNEVKWLWQAMWAPAIIRKDGAYYLFFGGNDMHEKGEGGIGVARADRPEGPYKDILGRPLIDEVINGAQPIDQFVFQDVDGTYYMYYGGWRHCNICKLNDDFTGLVPFEDGEYYKEVTPENYVEGPFMFMKDGKYYFMWSEGGWTGPDYCVAYAIADNPSGPFVREGVILKQDPEVGTGAGHHSVIHNEKNGKWYIVYHRHPIGSTDGNDRVVCIDEMHFDTDGRILPVKITFTGVAEAGL
jgi:beta-xylosidase